MLRVLIFKSHSWTPGRRWLVGVW